MRGWPVAFCLAVFPLLCGGWLHAAEQEVVDLNGQRFTLPAGFTIELVAEPPLVDRPITAAFDEQGRLYVADSSGSNDKVEMQLAEKPHRIVRLEDRNGDGKFDHSTIFADKMMFPEGTLWHDGSLYVSAPPSIWKLTDTDDDGVANERVEWFNGKTLTGCANDLHGPYLGRDGWIYWCKGAFAEQTYERPGKKPLVTRASHIFRARPDGSGIEAVMTGGMDNPVDVVFTPGGERIFSCTFLQQPAGGNRDGLIHALYGGVYGKVHDVIEGHPRTRPDVLPPLTHLGPAAPCGLAYYESQQFGPDYGNTLFTALFNLQKVTHHRLVPDGASYKTEDSDFVVSDNRDFHPTDVLEDADGSLLVVDTGGWYKLCCPTSQLVKPDVLGAIYRVGRKDVTPLEDPRGLKLAWSKLTPTELTELLADRRPAVRERAKHELAKLGQDAVKPLRVALALHDSPRVRRDAVWTLTRIDHADARAAVRTALKDIDDTVRQAALQSISLWSDREAATEVVSQLRSRSPATRRGAAEALGRVGDATSVAPLLKALETFDAEHRDDWALEHSLTFALIELAAADEAVIGLTSRSPRARRAALIALDQMGSDRLKPEIVADELLTFKNALRPTAQWILRRHPEWGDVLTPMLARQLGHGELAAVERAELEQQLADLAAATAIQKLLGDRLTSKDATTTERMSALRAISLAQLKQVPDRWVQGIDQALSSDEPRLVTRAALTLAALPLTEEQAASLQVNLKKVADDPEQEPAARLTYFATARGLELNDDQYKFLFLKLARNPDAQQRSVVLKALRNARLTTRQLEQLLFTIQTNEYALTPADAETVVLIAAGYPDDKTGDLLLGALRKSVHLRGMTSETVARYLRPFGDSVVEQARDVLATGRLNNSQQAEEFEKRLTSLKAGDVRKGQAVFNSAKANCSSCHSIGYLGGKLGPDLTKIGAIRNQRDLLEAILYPSASFVRSYEPVVVLTTDGESVSGLLRRNAADQVVIAKDAKTEVRIARADIEEIHAGRVSIMPEGLDRQLSEQDLADLLAFLQACK